MGLQAYLELASLLFCIGLYGALTRRNAIGILLSIELMLNASTIAFVAFARAFDPSLQGQVFAIFVITMAAAEAVVGLGLVLSIYRTRHTLFMDQLNILKW